MPNKYWDISDRVDTQPKLWVAYESDERSWSNCK